MLRRLVRSYYRLRYFPRVLTERLTGISNAVAGLHRYEAELISRLMSAHEERLARVHEEIVAFCDDAIRAMMAISASIAEVDTRLAALQTGLQRLDNGAVDTQGRIAVLQQSLERLHDQAGDEPARRAVPQSIDSLADLVRHQAAQIDRIEALVTEQARSPRQSRATEVAVPANGPTTPGGPGRLVGDDGQLSHG